MPHFSVGNGHSQAVAQGVIGDMCPPTLVSSRMPSFEQAPVHIATVQIRGWGGGGCYLFAGDV